MHTINLSNYDIRTDLIIEKNISNLSNNSYKDGDIEVDDMTMDEDIDNKKKGKYITIKY